MSVLKGEGKVPILFGMCSVPSGPLIHSAYLSRPDLTGEWPTIVVVSPAWGVTSSVKDICRRLARHGFAVIAPEPYPGGAPARNISLKDAVAGYEALGEAPVLGLIDDVVGFITNPAAVWSSAERGYGILGLGSGGPRAIDAAAAELCQALALVSAPLGNAGAAVVSLTPALLALHGRYDELAPVDGVLAFREAVPHGEFVLYDGVGHGFADDYSDEYAPAAAADAIERLIAFFDKELPVGP